MSSRPVGVRSRSDADSSPAIIGVAAGIAASGGDSIAGAGSVAINSIAGSVDAAHRRPGERPGGGRHHDRRFAIGAHGVGVRRGRRSRRVRRSAGAFSYNYIGGGDNLLNPSLLKSNSTAPVSPEATTTS